MTKIWSAPQQVANTLLRTPNCLTRHFTILLYLSSLEAKQFYTCNTLCDEWPISPEPGPVWFPWRQPQPESHLRCWQLQPAIPCTKTKVNIFLQDAKKQTATDENLSSLTERLFNRINWHSVCNPFPEIMLGFAPVQGQLPDSPRLIKTNKWKGCVEFVSHRHQFLYNPVTGNELFLGILMKYILQKRFIYV